VRCGAEPPWRVIVVDDAILAGPYDLPARAGLPAVPRHIVVLLPRVWVSAQQIGLGAAGSF